MRVKRANKSSIRTNDLIKQTLLKLLKEKKDLKNITVVDLVKEAGITRSSFYTHYKNISEILEEMEQETLNCLFGKANETNIKNLDDVYKLLDMINDYLKDNEGMYKLILKANASTVSSFVLGLNKAYFDTMIKALKPLNLKDLEIRTMFFTNGTLGMLIEYYKENVSYSLDNINMYTKGMFKAVFNEIM